MSKQYTAKNLKEMIANAESSGGSKAEIINVVKQWDEKAEDVCITDAGEILIDGTKLTDDEIENWFWWTQGGFKNRQGN